MEDLYKLYRVYKSVKKIKDFTELAGKIPPGQTLEKLAKKLGGGAKATKIQSKLNEFPAQPQSVIFSYVIGIGQCLYQGKSFSDAVECGKTKVRELGDNDVVNAPETCNNRLGQFELLGTGWPAPCQDPKAATHPQGNEAHRQLKWGLCTFFSWLYPKKLLEMETANTGTCDERFPTDQQIKDTLCEKYFGGSPCGGTFPLETEEDFEKVAARRKQYQEYLASFEPQVSYEGVAAVQAEVPSLFNGPNGVPLRDETCRGGKCGEICSQGKCTPTREFRQECNTCHIVDKCGECVLKPITVEGGVFFAGTEAERERLRTECRDNGECYFVPDRPLPVIPLN